ncbi:alpha/beta hydrolase [Herbaspirillum sp. alder98]|uniref:alpha/beta hydrolase n=1 Tax=Herbaspirillum sp. alder98 TaxID=2913096 RepID=UPI001CD864B0|nr:alpha/beta hydrolase [Herbaspirillum sp. alder98]MCA1323067.1 lysophospholipase [Herbaspirillum sp. alder98]
MQPQVQPQVQPPQESWFDAADGTRLFCRDWPVAGASAAVQLVHGLGEHGGRYAALAALFNAAGLSVRICDHRGHGNSGGRQGSLIRPDDLLQDLKLVFDDFARRQRCTPLLFGHSLGGLVAARFATGAFSPVRALMLSSPALALDLTPGQRLLLKASSWLAPGYSLPTALPAERISHDAAQVSAYRRDPLNHGKIAPRMLNFMLDAMAQVERDASTFTRPVLLQVAGDDAFVATRGSRAFYQALPGDNGTLHWYDQAYHELFNEEAAIRRQVEDDLRRWLAQLPVDRLEDN